MFLNRTKSWWECAIGRAERTVAQTLLSTLPVGFVVTPQMLKETDCTIVYMIVAWLITGLLGGLSSILTSYAKGIPEVDCEVEDDNK